MPRFFQPRIGSGLKPNKAACVKPLLRTQAGCGGSAVLCVALEDGGLRGPCRDTAQELPELALCSSAVLMV